MMPHPAARGAPRRRLLTWLLGIALCAGCLPPGPLAANATPAPRPTATADVATYFIYPEATPPPGAVSTRPVSSSLLNTLASYSAGPDDDPTGAKTAAVVTLRNFVDAGGPYRGAWWFAADDQGELDEILAVILFTEGNTSLEVRKAIAARFLWYCGGQGESCQGHALVNFLSYFQAWREPWMAGSGFTNSAATSYLALASDVIRQRGVVEDWIPGAAWFVQNPNGLSEPGPVDWTLTPFHFANVHPTWDAYLRLALGRAPNGPNRLWVLTVGEAGKVCTGGFVCPDMTQARP